MMTTIFVRLDERTPQINSTGSYRFIDSQNHSQHVRHRRNRSIMMFLVFVVVLVLNVKSISRIQQSIGYLIPLDVAIDPDYGLNSIQGYQLLEENSTSTSKINRIINAFQIEYSKKNDLLALRLIKTLDREICDSLHYVLQAYDGGQPQALVGRLNIRIQILDVNDMSPVFDRADIRVLLSESTSIGSLVARVHAFDADTGLTRQIRFNLQMKANE